MWTVCLRKLMVSTVIISLAFVVRGERRPESGSFEEKAAGLQWECNPEKGLPNVLILGDSVSIGYTLNVRELLKGKANVYRPLMGGSKKPDNCGNTRQGIEKIETWLGSTQWDVIHFNWGLHDLRKMNPAKGQDAGDSSVPSAVSLAEYEKNLDRLVDRLAQTGAVLIFGTTTPYPEGVTPYRAPADAIRYNEAACRVMNKHGVLIDDLYTPVAPKLAELQQPVNVHFNEEGNAFLGKLVADAIEKALPGIDNKKPQ